MARFSEQFIRQVAQAIDIVDMVSQYVALKKRGKEFVGLCPFHDDKNPSMYVTAEKQIFKCFSCGAGGGVYQFLMLYEKLTFPEAVRALAERANIPLPTDAHAATDQGGLSKADLVKVSTFAASFYRAQLHGPAGRDALQYARSRGLTDKSIERFALGYAPGSWDALVGAAGRKGFTNKQLVSAGLAAPREGSGGCYDRFRNRLIFPIHDVTGNVIAFGGRALAAEERAKYINSPESALFDKSNQLYALNFSREGISSTGQAVVVEGYLDALIPLQAGLTNVVATLGTALTPGHVRILGRYAREAVVIFDADAAGAAAAERAMEVFLAQQIHVRVATIPAGKDPCDLVLANGVEALQKTIAEAPDALQYIWNRRLEAYLAAGGNLSDRRKLLEDFLRLIVSCEAYGAIDAVRRGQLAQHIGPIIQVSPVDLQQQMQRLARRIQRSSRNPDARQGSAVPEAGVLAERHLLEVLLNRPELFDDAAERVDPDDFDDPDLKAIAQCLWALGRSGGLNAEDVLADAGMSQRGALVTDLAMAGERRENYEQTLNGAIEHLLYRRERHNTERMKAADLPSEDEMLRRLGRQLRHADVRRHPKIH